MHHLQLLLVAITCGLLALASVGKAQTIGSVRLVGGGSNYGVVEVQVNGVWGRVCDVGFDDNGANVICAQLGFRNNITGIRMRLIVSTGATTPVVAVTGCPNFRPQSESTWTLSTSCNLVFGSTIPSSCNALARHVSVLCTGQLTTPAPTTAGPTLPPNFATVPPTNCSNINNLRLVPGPNEGIVQIRNASTNNFGLICAAGFSAREAAVICRMLCRGSVNAIGESGRFLNETTGFNIALSGLTCPANANSTNDCTHNGWGRAGPCTSRLAVTVRCSPIDLAPPVIPTASVLCNDYKAHVYFSASQVPSEALLSLVGAYNASVCNFTTGSNGTTVWAEIPYMGCNSVQSTNDTHIIYTARLYKNITAVNDVYTDTPYIYPIICSIPKPKEVTAVVEPEARTAPPVGGGDSYTAEVRVFRNYSEGAFGSEIARGDKLVVGTKIYARVSITSPLNVRLTVRQCWAASSPAPTAQRAYFVRDKCTISTASLFRVDNKNVGVNFQVISFSDVTLTQVYIYCDVTICTETDTRQQCMQVCGSTVRKRRSVESDSMTETDAHPYDGPFRLQHMAVMGTSSAITNYAASMPVLVTLATMLICLMNSV